MVERPKISVVIPAHNASRTIADQIEALISQSDGSFEIVLVDNASSDGTTEAALKASGGMTIKTVFESRRGINFARNAGIEVAEGEVILLADADDIVGKDWVQKLSAPVSPGVRTYGLLELGMLNSSSTRKIRQLNGLMHNAGRNGSGCNLGFTKADWKAIGGFDPRLGPKSTEAEFLQRLDAHGVSAVHVPDAIVHYRLRSGLKVYIRDQYVSGRSTRKAQTLGLKRVQRYPLMKAIGHSLLVPFSIISIKQLARHLGAASFHLGYLSGGPRLSEPQ